MKTGKILTEKEILESVELIESYKDDMEKDCGNEKSELYRKFSLYTEEGLQFYGSLTDAFLLNILKKRAEELGHSPAQAEVFWVWRSYIKKRYGKWPYALQSAGLSKSAGRRGKTLLQMQKEKEAYEKLLLELQENARKLCRIPHPQEVPKISSQLREYTDDWNKIISDAGLNRMFFIEKSQAHKIENLETEMLQALDVVWKTAKKLGRPPLKSEISEEVRKPLIERCGSFRNVLFQIGLEPVTRINPFSTTRISQEKKQKLHRPTLEDCYYQVLDPDIQTKKDLEELYKISKALKYPPGKKEVDVRLRGRLQKSCGSWSNALNQLRYMEERK
ncbi:MAG TPA: hypothetical protein H9858_02365 [Candidatus Blautia stercoravium]|nr:hypothetical protein [Candidatus Blautia stercoravium]